MTDSVQLAVAQEKLQEVENLVKGLASAESTLEHGYAKLAYLLDAVSEHRYWQGTYESFGDYLKHISGTYNLGKSQLYNYRAAAHDLGDAVTQEQLDTMGISKALALREARNNTGSIPANVLTAALDSKTTVKDIKKLLFEAGTIIKPEDGSYRDADFSSYADDEKWATIQDAANAARHMDPPINDALPAHMQRMEILYRFAQEFLAAYQPLEGGKGL